MASADGISFSVGMNERKTILLLETVHEDALALLEAEARVVPAYGDRPLEDILAGETIHAIVTRGRGQVNRALLDRCPELSVVTRCGVGLDNVDVAAATERGIRVVNAPGSNSATVAEHTLTLMLTLMRQIFRTVQETKAGNWAWRNQYEADELGGKTLGILGLGNIGRRVARLAEAFGMTVVGHNLEDDSQYPNRPLEEVLSRADIVTMHLPLTPETNELINAERLQLMKPGALLINTARGQLIDQAALLEALDSGKLGGFGADVLADGPGDTRERLLRHPRTIITPHVASLTASTYRAMCVKTCQNTLAILHGQTPEESAIFNRQALAKLV